MSVINEGQSGPRSGQEDFVRRALVDVEKAHRFQRAKQLVITVLAFAAAFWLAFKKSGPELQMECTLIIVLGLAMGVCTSKIMSLIDKRTRTILQAIADLQHKSDQL
jgi:FtsH-binding integral membrane protein